MAYAFVQQKENDANATGQASIGSGAFGSSLTAGSGLIAVVYYQRGAPGSTSVTLSGAGSPTWKTSYAEFSIATTNFMRVFTAPNIGGGTTAEVVATFGANVDFPAIYVFEASGLATTDANTSYAGQGQSSPGTGTDAVTSGTSGTLSAQPAMVFGFTLDVQGIATPTAGTGYTSRTGAWDFAASVPLSARPEDKRVTATTATSATFTVGSGAGGSDFLTALIAWPEAAGGGGGASVENVNWLI